MSIDKGLVAWVREALEPIGTVTMRKMMGGATLYLDGTIFAIIGDGELYFKADPVSDATWDEAGCARFTMEMNGRVASMNYRLAPSEAHDDPEAMRHWAGLAVAAGERGAAKRKPRTPRRRPAA